MSRGRSGLLSLSPGTTPCQCAMSRWEPCRSTRGAGIAAGGRHASDRHLVARRTKRRTHLCQRPSITANARRESSYAPSRGCSGGSCNRQYRSCRCKGCGAGSNLAQSTKRDVGSAIGDNGGSAPRRSADMAPADTCPLVAGVDLIGKDPCARAGVLDDATYRRERLTKRRLLLSTTAAARRARSSAPSSLGCPGGRRKPVFPDQYRIELIERA